MYVPYQLCFIKANAVIWSHNPVVTAYRHQTSPGWTVALSQTKFYHYLSVCWRHSEEQSNKNQEINVKDWKKISARTYYKVKVKSIYAWHTDPEALLSELSYIDCCYGNPIHSIQFDPHVLESSPKLLKSVNVWLVHFCDVKARTKNPWEALQ